jgi:hypothetical protein
MTTCELSLLRSWAFGAKGSRGKGKATSGLGDVVPPKVRSRGEVPRSLGHWQFMEMLRKSFEY